MKPLTDRERTLLQQLARGMTLPEIVAGSGESYAAVHTRYKYLRTKLGAKTVAYAIAIGAHGGLIDLNDLDDSEAGDA